MPRFQGDPVETTAPRFGGDRVADVSLSGLVTGKKAAPKERSLFDEGIRTLGLGTRGVIEGIGDTIGIVSNPFIEGANLFGANQMTQGEAASALADRLGLPKPETPVERVSGDITKAVSGSGGLIGLGRGLVTKAPTIANAIGTGLSAAPGAQVAGSALGSGASGTVREQGGGAGAQLAAGLAGALAPSSRIAAADTASGLLASTVPQARKEIARQASDMGIKLTPGQLSDSRFIKWAQSMLRSIPFTGAEGRYQAQVGQFNRQLANTIGEQAENLGPEVYARAKTRQSQQFDELTNSNALKVDDQLIRSLSNVAESAKVSPDVAKSVEAAIDSLYSRATTGKGGVVIPGAAYQSFDSELGNIIKSGGPTAHFLGNVQSAVRRAMDKSISPQDAAAWQKLRTQYGNRKTLAPLAAKAQEGEIKPAQVLGAVTANRAGKEAMASGGRGQLGTLARIGQLMKEPPSSGTAERGVVSGLLGGASVIDPVTGGLTAAGLNLLSRGLDSAALAQLMIRENPGLTMDTAQAIIQRSLVPVTVTNQERR
jgi:hypothetical protein